MRKVVALCTVLLIVTLAAFFSVRYLGSHGTSDQSEAQSPTTSEQEPEGEGRGGDPDAGAVHAGEAQLSAIVNAPAAGWAGESVVGVGNTWEPSVAADPSSPYVYVM